jgi:enoyl-CoA hydratase/carnithine racemase
VGEDIVRVEPHPTATVVVLDNPAQQNVIDDACLAALHAALDAADPHKSLWFRGSGDGFSRGRPHHAGGHSGGPEAARRSLESLVSLNARVAAWPAPTVAVLHGYAFGAALGLAVHCDLVLAEAGTRMAFPEITYNLPPGLVVSYLRRYLPEKVARYLVMTGAAIEAKEAWTLGLVSRVVERGQLDAAQAELMQWLGERLEAEIALKASLNRFAPFPAPLEAVMREGVQEVLAWSARHAQRRPDT